MNINLSRAIRGMLCLGVMFSVGVALPTALPGVSEADAAQPRSSVDRRLRPGGGYFSSSPQARARSSAPSVARPMAPAAPMHQQGLPIVRAPQYQPQGQIVGRPTIMPQRSVVQQPGVVIQQPGVLVQQPMVVPQRTWFSAPQR
jgi:hypothetical protein